ncbi:unnamed protein product, partial [Rotaria sp. Silwood1]
TSNQKNLVTATNDLKQKQTIVELSKQKVQSLKQSIRDKENTEKSKVREIANEESLLEASKKNVQELKEEITVKRDLLDTNKHQYAANNAELTRIDNNIKDLQEEKNTCELDQQNTRQELDKQNLLYKQKQAIIQQQMNKIKTLQTKLSLLEA